jgi:hypothetical protein
MKKQLLLLFAALICGFNVLSQNKVNLVVFSEDAEPFYTYINGVRQNDKPETNVKITGISPNISLRIVFENRALPELKQNMSLEAGFEHTARIKRDNKQQMKLRYFGQTPIEESAPGVPTVAYHTAETTAAPAQAADGGQTTVTSTTTTTRTNAAGSENVSVNINMAGAAVNMNVTGMDPNGATMNSTSSTTVTSSSSSRTSASPVSETAADAKPTPAASNAGCSAAMSPSSFTTMKKSVEAKPFSDTRMSTAKVATKNNCLSIEQVKEICKLFSMDDDKLEYAKYAYDYCVEKATYYQVSDVFSFSGTTDDFNKFLEK